MASVRAALARYLRELDGALPDYPPFPAGQLRGGRKGNDPRAVLKRHANAGSINRTAWRKWFAKAEELARVPHLVGRAAYGIRRVSVDGAKDLKIGREALKEFGGWSDTQVPDKVYADQEQTRAREEAREIRARLRGEQEPARQNPPVTRKCVTKE